MLKVSIKSIQRIMRQFLSEVVLYDPPPLFALKSALGLLKQAPETRYLMGLVQGFKHLELLDPGSGDKKS